MFCDGWKHGHYAGNVFVLATSGIVIACPLNEPGFMNDLNVVDGDLYTKNWRMSVIGLVECVLLTLRPRRIKS